MLSTNEAARRLKQGEVVAIPTETVYGLAADASKLLAIQQIFTLKQRPSDNPLIIHIGCINQLDEFSKPMTEIELRIIKNFGLAHSPWFFQRKKCMTQLRQA